MFSPFEHSSHELSFQIPSTLHQQQQDHNHHLITSSSSFSASVAALGLPRSLKKPARKRSYNNLQQQDHQIILDNCDDDNEKKKKKMEHREIERKRRQEMANLYSSLRSLLPLDFIKGRRSTSEHMNQVVNYIKHLEENIKKLKTTRDELKKTCPHVTDESSSVVQNKNIESDDRSTSRNPITVTVSCSHGGVEILIKSCKGFSISRVVKVLVQEGLNVISCNSTKVNDRLIHSIHSEVTDEASIQVSILQKKLVELVL